MSSQNNINELVKFFFTLQLNIKIYHWNTTSYSRHKATDQFNEKLLDLVDKFVEVYIGRYKVKLDISNIKIEASFLSDEGSEKLLLKSKEYLEGMENILKDTDLLNIRDELLGEINQTLYLYRLV